LRRSGGCGFSALAGQGAAVKFRTEHRSDVAGSCSPFRIVDERGRELEWANRFLDLHQVRGLQPPTLRAYAHSLLHFVRWWSRQPGVDVTRLEAQQFTEATLLDYVRDQLNEHPKPSAQYINQRATMLRRLFRFFFEQDMPHASCVVRQQYWRGSPLDYGRRRAALADLHVKVPHRVIVPLQVNEVARFWASFRTARDLALVALMLLNGLRSREVLAMKLEDISLAECQLRVRGKGQRVRWMPLPPETIRVLDCYLHTERPATSVTEVFVSLKDPARGRAMTPAGLRSLFRHHRSSSDTPNANAHRFRHTFASDMIRAGVSLPALMRLMGHAHIQTTLLYIQLTPQDVFEEYTRAVAKLTSNRGGQQR
jgi:site-specific recombinase XerD